MLFSIPPLHPRGRYRRPSSGQRYARQLTAIRAHFLQAGHQLRKIPRKAYFQIDGGEYALIYLDQAQEWVIQPPSVRLEKLVQKALLEVPTDE